jgi:hypothetical protein
MIPAPTERETPMSTERERQAAAPNPRTWTILCSDGRCFQCSAPTESGALRVLMAERPGIQIERISSADAPAAPAGRVKQVLAGESPENARRVLGLMFREGGSNLGAMAEDAFQQLALLCKIKAHEDPAGADRVADSWGL